MRPADRGDEGIEAVDRSTGTVPLFGEGKSSKEAIRALKRRISDRVYARLVADARRATA